MPKKLDYPKASLKNSFQLAEAIDALGGSCSKEMAAEKLERKVSGAFHALIGGAVKFSLVVNKAGQLSVTNVFRDYKLAYNKAEADQAARRAFSSVPLFKDLLNRFDGMKLPVSHFEKLLIKEFGVPENMASKVSSYFISGAKEVGILNADNYLSYKDTDSDEKSDHNNEGFNDGSYSEETEDNVGTSQNISMPELSASDNYSVRIKGPGIDSVIEVNDPEDLAIVNAMLGKVKKMLSEE